MMYIKFLREWHGHKVGETAPMAAGAARELMRRKIAVATSTRAAVANRAVVVERAIAPPAEEAAIAVEPFRRGPGRPRKVNE